MAGIGDEIDTHFFCALRIGQIIKAQQNMPLCLMFKRRDMHFEQALHRNTLMLTDAFSLPTAQNTLDSIKNIR